MSQIDNVVVMFGIFLTLCILGISGKPSFSLNFPTLSSISVNERDVGIKLKRYTGRRVDHDSLRMVYFNDQTVAVVELGPNKLLLNCELIEILKRKAINKSRVIRKPWLKKGVGTLKMLNEGLAVQDPDSYKNFLRVSEEQFNFLLCLVKNDIEKEEYLMQETISAISRKGDQISEVLGEYKSSARPMPISFEEMRTLMNQCMQLQSRQFRKKHRELHKNNSDHLDQGRSVKNPFTLLNGIIPGTKWCGTGDIASNYFDLGTESTVDMCCRAHDLCPVKIRAYSRKYNLTNNSLYTKSHCRCDDDLFDCLKKSQSSATANIMGNIYFNLVQVPCLEEKNGGVRFRTARNNF